MFLEEAGTRLLRATYIFLWVAFVVCIFDPQFIGHVRLPGSFIANYAFIINPIEAITNVMTSPVRGLFEFLGWVQTSNLLPEGANGWFPITTAGELAQQSQKINLPLPSDLYEGALNCWIVVTIIAIKIAVTTMSWVYPSIRNSLYNIFVDYTFHGKQVKRLESHLEEANQKVVELNNQNRFLTKETTVLKDTVITDELTKVFNRRFFLERIRLEYRQSKQRRGILSLIMVDIDYFKRLNDTYGHLAGDDVLKCVAGILKTESPMNTYPCRYGGEEFAIILPGYTAEMAEKVAVKISRALKQLRYPQIDPTLAVTISQGICAVNFEANEAKTFEKAEDILECADQMLYKSKMDGRDRVSVKEVN